MPPFVTGPEFRHRRAEDGKLYGLCHSTSDPDTVDVASVPRVVPAQLAFSPAELQQRLDYYADRAARGVPLFSDGGPVVELSPAVRCMGCGAFCPTENHVAHAPGWVSLRARGSTDARDVYCPTCFWLLMEDADDAA